jgi:hypothetical protein
LPPVATAVARAEPLLGGASSPLYGTNPHLLRDELRVLLVLLEATRDAPIAGTWRSAA